MAILIKGMEMPTTCGSCWFCHAVSNEKWHCRLTGKSFASYSVGWGNENNTGENGQRPYIRRDDCPLIEVPEPHGRLIAEADAIETAWMILQGLGYRIGENQQLEESVREVFATAPAIEVE